MAGVRDPAFWKRFSMAVHLDEEKGHDDDPDSWLNRQHSKKSRKSWICWSFWMCLFLVIAGMVAVIIWLLSSHILDGRNGTDEISA